MIVMHLFIVSKDTEEHKDEPDDDPNNKKQCNSLSQLYAREFHKPRMKMSKYCKHVRNLNPHQQNNVIFNCVWRKAAVAICLGKLIHGYKISLSGPGGTGKSHVSKLIHRDVIDFSQQTLKSEPDGPLVLLTVPTGSAAFHIGGTTLHVTFKRETDNLLGQMMNYANQANENYFSDH